ncbi:ABC transporter substrate-binding protein [Winogradskyella alexanderae]|uniref:Helical backbone metal receptor n=1 Tax=Winogradskyella alexanderae TaxID=2877123 RepID=A0ABS7XXL6_9FLAO|nr:helical backbone metal receptor [Winogradskyella alexanderae]MCA0133731.1 helical backbone metal receptor [Winogradskyella alexanderae]
MHVFKDQLNRKIRLKSVPKRIVSLVPSQTELLVDLGLKDCIVGVTKFCVHPIDIRKQKAVVGGTKAIKIKKIKALKPDIILCNKEENTLEIVNSLDNIAPVHISDIYSIEDCYELITMYGEIFDMATKAKLLIVNIENQRKSYIHKKNKANSVAYFIWKAPWMVVGSNTFIDAMISEAGFENSFKSKVRYPEIQLDDDLLKEADFIFLSSEPYPFKASHIAELKNKFPDKTIKIVSGEFFSWYGSRLLGSFNYFRSLGQ